MNELVKISYDNDRPTVIGRELHEALDVKTKYADWFNRMCEYGFTENVDYTRFSNLSSENQHGGQNKIDHQLTIGMAKEICMLQRTEISSTIRKCFITVEEQMNNPDFIMARALQMSNKRISDLQNHNFKLVAKINEDKPKVIFADSVTTSHTSILIGDLAKILKGNGISIGQNRLFEWLRNNEYLIKRKGTGFNTPTQKAMDLGLFEVKETVINHSSGYTSINKTTKVTGKGQVYFVNKFLDKSVNN